MHHHTHYSKSIGVSRCPIREWFADRHRASNVGVSVSRTIMWFSLTSCGAGDGRPGYTIWLRFFVPIA